MVSNRVKYALAHLSRKKHEELLARPNWRQLQKRDIHCTTNPYAIRRAALRCRPSKRLKIMSQPRFVNRKFDPTEQPSGYPIIHPRTLAAKPTRRTEELSLPSKRNVLLTKKLRAHNKSIVRSMDSMLEMIKKSRYQKYRVYCNARARRAMAREARLRKKLHRALSKPEDWEKHKKTLERIAVPKPKSKPTGPDRGEKISLEDIRERLEFLAQPVVKDAEERRDPFAVSPTALKYRITDRVREIATRKLPRDTIPPKSLDVSPAAIRAVASPRTIILAKPAVRPPGMETDLKEDAFGVPARALKARCSPRTKVLARPKTYGKVK